MNVLNLPLDQFQGYLAESAQYGMTPERRDDLMRQYRAKNQMGGIVDYLEKFGEEGLDGKRVSAFLPIAGPQGMSLFDAMRSGQAQTRFGDYFSDIGAGILQALGAPEASAANLMPEGDMVGEAMGTAGMANLAGGAVVRPQAVAAANASATTGAAVLGLQAKANPKFAAVLRDNDVDPNNIDAANFFDVRQAITTAANRNIIDVRDGAAMLQSMTPQNYADFYGNASKTAGLLAMNQAPMIAHHNTSLAGLKAARDIGGIPMPSIAISNAKTPVENFGDISLLMRPDQIDPKSGVNVFPADGYTGRQPKGFFDFTNQSAARSALRNDPDFGHFGSSWIDSTNGFSDANYIMQVAQFGRDRGIGNPKDFKEIRDYNSFVRKQVYKFGDETDQTAFSQVSDKDGLTAYGETQMLISPKEPYTPSGQRRDPKPYTLDEAYKRMRQNKANQAGSEGHSGPGLLRAVSSKQFKSLDEIKKNRGLLKPDDNDMADVKGTWDTFSYDAIDDLAQAHFNGRHRVAEDYVTDLASGKSVSWAEATPEARKAAQGTIKALREEAKGMPTEYFEAKPKSVQTLGDFDTALVPAGNQEAIDILRRQGVKNIQEYGDQKTRAKLMQEQENLFFANASPLTGIMAMLAQPQDPTNSAGLLGRIMAQ